MGGGCGEKRVSNLIFLDFFTLFLILFLAFSLSFILYFIFSNLEFRFILC